MLADIAEIAEISFQMTILGLLYFRIKVDFCYEHF